MRMFTIVSHTADIALKVSAEGLDNLFLEATRGFRHLLFEDAEIASDLDRKIDIRGIDREDLLVQWLSELNYYIIVHQWAWRSVKQLSIREAAGEWHLSAIVDGETMDEERHFLYFDIKAVTYHQLEIVSEDDKFHTQVVFDI